MHDTTAHTSARTLEAALRLGPLQGRWQELHASTSQSNQRYPGRWAPTSWLEYPCSKENENESDAVELGNFHSGGWWFGVHVSNLALDVDADDDGLHWNMLAMRERRRAFQGRQDTRYLGGDEKPSSRLWNLK